MVRFDVSAQTAVFKSDPSGLEFRGVLSLFLMM